MYNLKPSVRHVGFALHVSRTIRVFIQIWDIFCGACSQWKELALVMRKCLPLLIIDANSPIDCKLHKKMSQIWMNTLIVLDTRSANPMRVFKCTYSWWNVKSDFCVWKECMITEQWKRVMIHNQTNQIVHSSAMYYQNLIIIHECSKKLLKMKNSTHTKLTPSTYSFSAWGKTAAAW